ncbi:MAG: hypothetical protein IPI14_07695 [Polaromonas sp.]|nr:hypothetical protein [Polaromonas sp.]
MKIDNKERKIHLENEGPNLRIIIDGEQTDINAPRLDDEERVIYSKNGRLEEYLEEQRLRFINNAGTQVQRFLKLPRPLFLGLERRTGRYDDESSIYEDNTEGHVYRPARRFIGSAVEGLENCQRLLDRMYRNYRRISDNSSNRLINVIFESTFDYIEFNSTLINDLGSNSTYFQELLTRRQEIEAIANDLGGGRQAIVQMNNFFTKITEVVQDEPSDGDKRALEFMLKIARSFSESKKCSLKWIGKRKLLNVNMPQYQNSF